MKPATTPRHSPASSVPPAVEVRTLYYHYPDGTEAIQSIDFRIAVGECVGLIGPNGAGKSTLLLHLNGILPDDTHATGEVRIDGELLTRKNLHEIRRRVGLVFQDPDDQIFCPTVFDDVAFGPQQFGLPKEQVASIVSASLARVGLQGFERRAPHRLSGGEKRRVCIAGVLACEPSVLVLDEPTSNLDPRSRRSLMALLESLPCTRLIATHDLEMVLELCPRSILVDGGRVVADGPTVDLLADAPLMEAHGLECPSSLSRGRLAGQESAQVVNDLRHPGWRSLQTFNREII